SRGPSIWITSTAVPKGKTSSLLDVVVGSDLSTRPDGAETNAGGGGSEQDVISIPAESNSVPAAQSIKIFRE
ncbi:MAG: hypothetical protein KDK27_08750, partial [Leptospiraceae bacterium]|nr:hypothetical protein [Leptospiraceae bacterium]